MAGNLANLQKATAARTAAAIARAETALDAMTRDGETITFRSLAARAGVSLDFLYRNTAVRTRIEGQRATQPARPAIPAASPGTGHPSSVARALTAQLTELKRCHREETTALRQALEQAQGENLLLRRKLAGRGHEPAPPGQ